MKKIFFLIFFILLPFLVPVSAHAEQINSFDATYSIKQNGTVGVEEKILYDFGSTEHHGIYRTLILTKTNTDGKTFQMVADNFSVSDQNGHRTILQRVMIMERLLYKLAMPTGLSQASMNIV